MNLVFRIVFAIVVGVIFISITFSTFFITKQYASIADLNIDSSKNLYTSGSLYYTNISKFESLYSTHEILQDISLDDVTIPVNKQGKYVSSLRNIGTSYNFTGTGYIISQKGIGELYIDTITRKGKVFVYAKNTPVEIKLISDDEKEIYTTIYLAPGMYIEFRTGIGKNLNNADRLRISTVNKLGYISSLFNGEIDSRVEVYFSQEDNILYDSMRHIGKTDSEKKSFLASVISSNIPEISGNTYIQRYLHLFVNKEKKKIFYKNTVLSGYISLIDAKKVDESLISQIKKDEIRLKSIDSDSYQKVLSLRGEIISALYSMQGSHYITSKLLFSRLVDSGINESAWMYPLYSFSLFSGSTQESETSEFITKSFFESFAKYMENYQDTENPYDYFLYFLEQRLLFLLSGNIDEQSIGSTIEILSNYAKISNDANYGEKNQKITQIYSITQILESLDTFLRNTYFLSERDSNNLLVLRSNISLGGTKLSQLQTYINSLYALYDTNKSLLNTISARDIKISENIIMIKRNIDEYISAIGNYAQYKDLYDISKSTILNVDVINNGQLGISEALGKQYLSQFIGISQESFSLSVIDESYYKVDNLIIGGRRFDFEIYPYSSSKLKNILIDGELQTTQYTLDNIQEDWSEKFKTASQEEKPLFDFSRFFILTFLTLEQREVIIFDKEYKQEESKAEIVFKRDILLGDKGEFSSLANFLRIDYSDINLIKEGDSYDIFLSDTDFSFTSIESKVRKKLSGKLNSQYILNATDHDFTNVAITVESDKKGPNNSTVYDFGGARINLSGNIYINQLGDYLQEMFSNIDVYLYIYSTIERSTNIENLAIEYTPVNKKTRFKFDSGQKNFTIILQNGDITGIYEGTSKLASSPILPGDIKDYLQ